MGQKAVVRVLLTGLAVLLQACAVGPMASGGLVSPAGLLPGETPGVVLLHDSSRREPEFGARQAEVECALAQVLGLVRGVDEVGARVEVRFWAHGGALTLLSHRATGGQGRARPVDPAAFATRFRNLLSSYVGERTGEAVFTLYRQDSDWRVDFRGTSDVPRPPEAKTQPVRREGVSVETYVAVTRVATEMARLMGGPTGEASFTATVALDDDGVSGWEAGPHAGTGREVGSAARERLQSELIQVLLPFTHGVGPREVHLTLQGVLPPGEPAASWRVVVAETLHPRPTRAEEPDLIAEYRALHESILREWREEVEDSARQAVLIGAEEMALWVIGGVVAHGTGVILEAAAPRLIKIVLRGGAKARGWLSTLLRRLPKAEQEAFSSLWARVDLRGGARSLSKAEELELTRLAKRLEELVDTPLSQTEKTALRDRARIGFRQLHPELAEAMRLGKGGLYEIHHRRPLEYAHLLVGEDINARNNLVAVAQPVHRRISGLWAKFRNGRGGSELNANEVRQIAEIIDRHFHRWYDVLYDPQSTSALDMATEMALRDIEKLLARG